ncbi:MAG: hypothetical protein K2Y39_23285 [Candidatus Obscuribacterales bacterium]|nr:hypothetical protein [Candidatus Obscuribacterales bacterium]
MKRTYVEFSWSCSPLNHALRESERILSGRFVTVEGLSKNESVASTARCILLTISYPCIIDALSAWRKWCGK